MKTDGATRQPITNLQARLDNLIEGVSEAARAGKHDGVSTGELLELCAIVRDLAARSA